MARSASATWGTTSFITKELTVLCPDTTEEERLIGTAKPDAWNDVKIYYKKSQGSDGQLRVYLNGIKVFERANQKNMIGRRSDGSGGYVKFGMYTEIRDERVISFRRRQYVQRASSQPICE